MASGVPAPAAGTATAATATAPRDQKEAPVRKLTTGLLATYKLINTRYYQAKKDRLAKQAANETSSSRKVEEYQVTVGDLLGPYYRVEESMGKGSFGQVVAATDIRKDLKVAVKVIKNKEAFRRQAKTEIKLLELLNRKDPDDQWCIVRFLEQFDFHGHTCIVFEHLSFNLYELLKKTHFRGVSLTLIRKFARQILKALAYLSLPEIDVIHCDLKPENILFRQPNRSAIKVIDFGSSCQGDKKMYKYIQSRFYRSPEVILELPYDQAIDMWSLGCILVEMHTGMPLFSGRDEADQMRRFIALKGLPPMSMLAASKKAEKFFEIVQPAAGAAMEGVTSLSGLPSGMISHARKHSHASSVSSGGGRSGAQAPTHSSETGRDSHYSAPQSDQGSIDIEAHESVSDREVNPETDSEYGETSDSDEEHVDSDSTGAKRRRRHHRQTSNPSVRHPTYKLKPLPEKPAESSSGHSSKEPTVYTDLRDVIGVSTGGPGGRRKSEKTGHTKVHYTQFLDLIERMLDYNPSTRIKPMQALNHPFVRDDVDTVPGGDSTSGGMGDPSVPTGTGTGTQAF